jgi:hypothetical protein
MPEHLGKFHKNFVLHHAVCCECNKSLGDQLELWLGRDSFEALQRWRFGQRPISDFDKFRGRGVRLRMPRGSPWQGAIVILRAVPESKELVVDLTPQIGIKRPSDEGFRFYTEDEFRKASDSQVGVEKGSKFIVIGLRETGSEAMIQLVRTRVPTFKIEGALPAPPQQNGKVMIDIVASFSQLLARGIAKIAFNYMTFFAGTDFALHEDFNDIRRFIRYGKGQWSDFVDVKARSVLANDAIWYGATRAHIVTVDWPGASQSIVSNVSLFNELAYSVALARWCTTVWRLLIFGHLFDWETGEITRLATGCGLTLPWQMTKP